MELSPDALEQVVIQLQSSGIQFSITFVGSVRCETSINNIPTQYQSNVALSGIRMVARKAKLKVSAVDNDQFADYFTNSTISIYNDYVNLNISSSAILIVDMSGISMNIFQRFEISSISVVSEGKDDLAFYFCFFAKTNVRGENERRCFVFYSEDCVDEIRDVICYAFRISEIETLENSMKVPEIKIHNDVCDRPPIPGLDLPNLLHCSNQSLAEPLTSGERNKRTLSRDRRNKHLNLDEDRARQRRLRSASANRDEDYDVNVSNERLEEIMADLEHQKWYHGRMTRDDAEQLIRKKGQFLIRQSTHLKNQFVLSALADDEIKHVCLVNEDGTLDLFSIKFKTIVGLISCCRENQILLPKYGVSLDYSIKRQGFSIS